MNENNIPKNPPPNWIEKRLPKPMTGAYGRIWCHRLIPDFCVIRSISTTTDGKKWVHISLSKATRIPEYAEIKKVKDEFLGDNIEAYQVFPRKAQHVNLHKNCLHLWAPLDGQPCVANLFDLTMEEAF